MSILYFISGDWPFYFLEQIHQSSWWPVAYKIASGLGENVVARLWIDYPFQLLVKAATLMGISWGVLEKLLLLGIVFCGWISTYHFAQRFEKAIWARMLSASLYTFNTYTFLVLGGGQLGVAAAIAFVPVTLHFWLALFDTPSTRRSIITGIVFAILIALDLRIAYIAGCIVALYALVYPKKVFMRGRQICGSLVITASLHLYWILPIVLSASVPLPEGATGRASLSFFSVADFSHAMTLLHPNWPENLFGKVYFQKPEFLILPIIAFAALFFQRSREILFFALVGLIGIFLAKGVNAPGGWVYDYLFAYVPGFFMFRDATKFYTLIAFSYAFLIPVTIRGVSEAPLLRVSVMRFLFIGVLLSIPLILSRDIWMGNTSHSFQFSHVPGGYTAVKTILQQDTTFSRVAWLPQVPQFAYADALHPALSATDALGVSSASAIAAILQEPHMHETLSEKGVGYVVVPTDERHSMFLTDYTYDESQRTMIREALTTSGLPFIGTFDGIDVYKNPGSRALFATEREAPVPWEYVGANRFVLTLPPDTRQVTMRVAFDPAWRLAVGDTSVGPKESSGFWVRFDLPRDATGSARITFASDKTALWGVLISSMLFVIYCWMIMKKRI